MEHDEAQKISQLIDFVDSYDKTHQLELLYKTPMSQADFEKACRYELEPDGRPYPWAVKFHNAGEKFPDRALLAANRVGKSRTCGAEVSIHATGLYPDWWKGRRYDRPTSGCICGETNEQMRDIQQLSVYGGLIPETSDPAGTGWIPKESIVSWSYRQCGIKGVFDEVKVRHVSGGVSTIKHKAYEQGWTKFQGTQFDWYWIDEEPTDPRIFAEIIRGTFNTDGMIFFSRTPTFGMTQLVTHFMDKSKGTYYQCVSLDEAPHMTEKQKARFIEGIPEHEIDTRTKGIPMMGSGIVYPIDDKILKVEPFDIPLYWRRIAGIDFGISHPTAVVWVAHDPDSDVVYLYDAYQTSDKAVPYHAAAIKARGDWIPVSWPHDGLQRDKGSATPLKEHYMSHGVNMIHHSARFDDKTGGGQSKEAAVQDVLERMVSGRFRVFSHLNEWFLQKGMYHRKDGVINPVYDDMMKATDYALMMLRYAEPVKKPAVVNQMRPYEPMSSYA